MNDVIKLTNFRTAGVVGWLAIEQQTPQPIDIELELHLDVSNAADNGDLSQTVDYSAVQSQVVMLVSNGSWRLIESLATGIARLVLAPPGPGVSRAHVQAVTVTVGKPAILAGAVPSVSIHRTVEWCDLRTRMEPPATWIDVLAETPRCGAYRMHIDAGSAYQVPAGLALEVVAGDITLDGRRISVGERVPAGSSRGVSNPGDVPATVLAVGPSFMG